MRGMNMINPFTGSTVKVTEFYSEDEIKTGTDFGTIHDENERYILYLNGILVKKTKSSVFYDLNKQ